MSTFEILLVIYAAILAAAALGVVYRMVVGPTILDRAISSDSLVTLVVMGMALYAAHAQAAWAGPALLGLTGLAFIGTVTFARFVAREDPMQGRRTRHSREPRTDTGPHEAIHPDPSSSEAWDQAPGGASDSTPGSTPGNTFVDAESQDPLTAEDPLEDPLQPGEALEETGRPGEGRDAPQQPEPFEDGDEHGFGAQPGWRGFEDERRGVRDPGTTEEPR
ncbi:MAG: monovalent cation/H+ antiporter complex subunit F [Brachybacterium sp.]|uniref:monovalent cation/H+ antiporter complex subunit F n=1 Tax=unclassified Brachybacterium TaxID=2623841 RepID=UPI003F906172